MRTAASSPPQPAEDCGCTFVKQKSRHKCYKQRGVVYGNKAMARLLLDHGADVNAERPCLVGPLWWRHSSTAKGKLLIS
ncbi:hypothetical protein WJX77_008661 [Trebouxia sp. C0004]